MADIFFFQQLHINRYDIKYLFVTVFAITSISTVYAQNFSAGLRTGIGNTIDIAAIKSAPIENTWDKEIFTRYETKGRLAFEASATQYYTNYNPLADIKGYKIRYDMTVEPASTMFNNNIIDFGLSAQYEITCSQIQKCPLLSGIKSFIGINTAISYQNSTVTMYDRLYSDASIRKTVNSSSNILNPQIGLNHTLVYNFKNLSDIKYEFYG